jgi:Tol biopolymer transport system component
MSPEQVRGKEADHRSDIFSFGVILYELLSSRRAFHGDTAAETMTDILKQELPDLPDTVPPGVRQSVHHCLEKDPENRFQSARDLSFALAAMSHSASQSGAAANLPGTRRWRRWVLAGAGSVGLMALTVVAYRLVAPVPKSTNWSGALLGGPEIAFRPRPSPDGHLLAFYAVDRGYTQVGVMKPETGNWSMLTHSLQHGNVTNVAWAPDGASIYYDRLGAVPHGIYSVPVLGGDERLVFPEAFRPEALPDGSLLAVKLNSKHEWQLFRFWPATGRVQDLPVAAVEIQESLANPRAFPGGKEVLIDGAPLGREAEGMRLLVMDLATGTTRPLAPGVSRGTGSPDFAVSRDGKSVVMTLELGEFTRVISVPAHGRGPVQTLFTTTHEVWGVDTAPDGSVYACVTDLPAEVVSRPLDRDQAETWAKFPEVSDPDALAVLPDGRVVLTVLYSDRARLMAVEPGKSPVAMVATTEETSTPVTVAGPREIAFLIGPVPRGTIALAEVETGRITRRLTPGKGEIVSLAASPDGGTLYFATGGTIWSIPSAGGEARKIRAGNRVVAADPSGRTLLVSVLESPNMRLFRVPLDGSPETEVPADAGHALRYTHLTSGSWNADGRLLVSLHDSWFAAPAVLDTRNGRVQPLPSDNTRDYISTAWLPGGRMVALRIGMRSTLWRFAPTQE